MNPGIVYFLPFNNPIVTPTLQNMAMNMIKGIAAKDNMSGINTFMSADPINLDPRYFSAYELNDQEHIKNSMNAAFIPMTSRLNNKSASAAILKLILLLT